VWVLNIFMLVFVLLAVVSVLVKHPLVTAAMGVWCVVLGLACLVWWRTGVDYAIWYKARRLDEVSRKEWLARVESGRLRTVYRVLILFVSSWWIIGGCVFAVAGIQRM
jgi:hypothetical protein